MTPARLITSLALLGSCSASYCQARPVDLGPDQMGYGTGRQTVLTSEQAKPPKKTAKPKVPKPAEPSLEDSISQYDLAKAIVDEADCINVVYEQALINSIPASYINGPSASLTEAESVLEEDNKTLSDTEFDDPAMEAARKDLVVRMAILLKDMAKMRSAIMTAEVSGGWVDQAVTPANAALNEAQGIRGDGSVEALTKKPSFQSILPNYYLEVNRLIPDPTGFKLNVLTLVNDPLFIIYVDPNGLGAKLNLTNLERIEEFNGKAPKSMDDLKNMIRRAAGEAVTFKVKNSYGVESENEVTVPVNLNPWF